MSGVDKKQDQDLSLSKFPIALKYIIDGTLENYQINNEFLNFLIK